MALMVREAVGVRRRLPAMIRAGAKTLTGFLNEMFFPAREKVSSQEPSWIQAPSSFASTAFAGNRAQHDAESEHGGSRYSKEGACEWVLVERQGKPLGDLTSKETGSLLWCLI